MFEVVIDKIFYLKFKNFHFFSNQLLVVHRQTDRLSVVTLDGKWLHPAVIFGLRRHKNLKVLKVKMNSDRSIPRYDWRDHFSINNVFQFHGEEQVCYFYQN